jgi:hypothetical protein
MNRDIPKLSTLCLLKDSARMARIPLILLLWTCVAACLHAQNPAHQQVRSDQPDSDFRQKQRAAFAKKTRFLGWNLAKKLGQTDFSLTPPGLAELGLSSPGASRAVSPFSFAPPVTASAAFANAGFSSAPRLPTGFIPTAITAADFNGDGKMDVAVANGGDNTIYVLLGNGDGTFKDPEVLFTQGQSPTWITSASLRNNGKFDLAVTDGDSNSVEIFLGNGDGTFQPSTQFTVPNVPTFVVAGDFNKDGKPDLAIALTVDANTTAPEFEILLGDGAGGFPNNLVPPTVTAVLDPIITTSMAVGDVNNDGFPDIVTTQLGCCGQTYLNHSGTGFGQGPLFGPQAGALVIGLGDMDGDGCLDAVELDAFGLVTVAKGTCDGLFTASAAVAASGDLDPAIVIADINGDGHLDVVASAVNFELGGVGVGLEAGYLVSVMTGDGKGNLSMARTYRVGSNAVSLVVADFNGDLKPDIITVDQGENHATLLLNDGTGGYLAPQGEAIGYTSGVTNAPNPTAPLEVADLNGDGKADLLLVEDGQLGNQPSQLTAILNDGTGKFLPPVRTPITVGPNVPFPQFVAGNFRTTAKADVIYITRFFSPNLVAFFAGNGDGSFATPVTLANLANPLAVVAGDFNGDGKLDFVVAEGSGAGEPATQFDVFLGHGDGTFTQLPPQTLPVVGVGGIQQFIAVDLNHDGKLDLLIGNNSNGGFGTNDSLLEALGNGDGTFQAPTVLFEDFGSVAVADLNHDGFPDLIQLKDPNIPTTTLFTQTAVTIYLGTASGGFQKLATYDLPGFADVSFDPALVGDFNGDGNIDIAVRYLSTNLAGFFEPRLRILQGVGDGTFIVTNHFYQLPGVSRPFVGADFNSDGKTDLVELVGFTASFNTIFAAPAPSLDIAFNSSPIVGNQGSATVTLDQPAAAATDVTLSASDPAVSLPGTLHFAPGQQSQSFSVTLGAGFDQTHALALTATLGTESAVAYAAKPNPNVTTGVAASLLLQLLPVSSVVITPGETLSPTFSLASESGYTGTFGSFACNGLPANTSCSFGSSAALIPEGGLAQVASSLVTTSSTPFGVFPVQFTTTDGVIQSTATLQLGIGDFSIQLNPSLFVLGPTGQSSSALTSSSTNGLNETVVAICQGLPSSVRCGQSGNLFANGGSTGLSVADTQLAAGDYPFQLVATAGALSHSINAVLRVGDFTVSLDKNAATLSAGQSATFNVTLNSINHYTSTITIFCQPASQNVTCQNQSATLADNGTAMLQLVISRPASGAASSHVVARRGEFPVYLGLFGLAAVLLVIRRRKQSLVVATIILLALTVSCGGGGSAPKPVPSPTPTPTPTPTPAPQTVKVSVIAQAAPVPADSLNQKTLGPIVITLN